MRSMLSTAGLLAALVATTVQAQEVPKVEVAPVIGAQFFRGINGPGVGDDQGLQNMLLLGARGGALFGDRLRLELGLDLVPTMAVGVDRPTYVIQPHFDLCLDADTGWLRPYMGVGVGIIGFVDQEWVSGSFSELAGESNTGIKPDVEFAGALIVGARFYLGEFVDGLQDTLVRVDLRDVLYAPRNNTVNYMQQDPGKLVAFSNLQFSLSFAWVFDAFGESEDGDYYDGLGSFRYR